MTLPFVGRKRYENERGRIVVYEPIGKQNFNDVQIPTNRYEYHDRRIGWVERLEFKDYRAYINHLKTVPETKPNPNPSAGGTK